MLSLSRQLNACVCMADQLMGHLGSVFRVSYSRIVMDATHAANHRTYRIVSHRMQRIVRIDQIGLSGPGKNSYKRQ